MSLYTEDNKLFKSQSKSTTTKDNDNIVKSMCCPTSDCPLSEINNTAIYVDVSNTVVDDSGDVVNSNTVVDDSSDVVNSNTVVDDSSDVVNSNTVVDDSSDVVNSNTVVDDSGDVVNSNTVVDDSSDVVNSNTVVDDSSDDDSYSEESYEGTLEEISEDEEYEIDIESSINSLNGRIKSLMDRLDETEDDDEIDKIQVDMNGVLDYIRELNK